MKLRLLCFCFLLLTPMLLHAQPAVLDSLKKELARYDKTSGTRKPQLRDSVKVQLLDALAMAAGAENLELARNYALQERELAQKINYPKGAINATILLARIHQDRGELRLALAQYDQLQRLAQKARDHFGEMVAYQNMGQIQALLANYTEAVKLMLQGISLARKSGDLRSEAASYNNLGELYRQLDNRPEALKNFNKALQIARDLGDKHVVAFADYNIGRVLLSGNQFDKAIPHFAAGLQAARQSQDMESEYLNHNGIGQAYAGKARYTEALQHFFAALDLATQQPDPKPVLSTNLLIGRTYYEKKQFAPAQQYLKKGLVMAVRTGDLLQQMNAHEVLAKIHQETRDYKKALESQMAFKTLTDSVYRRDQSETTARLKMRYDLKSAQDSIAVVQNRKDILARAALDNQRNQRNFGFVVLGLIVLFLVVVIWQRNKLSVIKRQKALEEERNRISRDLHDNLGSQLSTVRMFMSSIKNSAQPDTINEKVNSSIDLLDASMGELRGIMREVQNPVLLEQGYLSATESLINQVNGLHGVRFALSHHKMDARLDPEIEHQLYRITQELINNTLKYAQAQNVTLDLLRRDGKLVLMYEDDGLGYDPDTVRRGNGLSNIEARVKALGGTVEFDATPGNGARTNIEIPVNHA